MKRVKQAATAFLLLGILNPASAQDDGEISFFGIRISKTSRHQPDERSERPDANPPRPAPDTRPAPPRPRPRVRPAPAPVTAVESEELVRIREVIRRRRVEGLDLILKDYYRELRALENELTEAGDETAAVVKEERTRVREDLLAFQKNDPVITSPPGESELPKGALEAWDRYERRKNAGMKKLLSAYTSSLQRLRETYEGARDRRRVLAVERELERVAEKVAELGKAKS